ncbi:MAG: DUF4214 domain-containing protein [Microcystis aeruginosa SX13-11]|jgi:hypothetical protein|nr:DUF4214 domain-containing protein [Microcystis aeruginosa SX13-11]
MATINPLDLNTAVGLYVIYFGRSASYSDLNNAVAAGRAGVTNVDLATQFGQSQEAKTKYPFLQSPLRGNVDEFINQIYQNMFDRAADAEGLVFWRQKLLAAGGSSRQVALFVLEVAQGAQPGSVDFTTLQKKADVALSQAVPSGDPLTGTNTNSTTTSGSQDYWSSLLGSSWVNDAVKSARNRVNPVNQDYDPLTGTNTNSTTTSGSRGSWSSLLGSSWVNDTMESRRNQVNQNYNSSVDYYADALKRGVGTSRPGTDLSGLPGGPLVMDPMIEAAQGPLG